MSRRIYLGELEELILLMVALIGAGAYGVSVTEELEAQTGRVISISAAHAVLHRLEEKDLLNRKWAELRWTVADGGRGCFK